MFAVLRVLVRVKNDTKTYCEYLVHFENDAAHAAEAANGYANVVKCALTPENIFGYRVAGTPTCVATFERYEETPVLYTRYVTYPEGRFTRDDARYQALIAP